MPPLFPSLGNTPDIVDENAFHDQSTVPTKLGGARRTYASLGTGLSVGGNLARAQAGQSRGNIHSQNQETQEIWRRPERRPTEPAHCLPLSPSQPRMPHAFPTGPQPKRQNAASRQPGTFQGCSATPSSVFGTCCCSPLAADCHCQSARQTHHSRISCGKRVNCKLYPIAN